MNPLRTRLAAAVVGAGIIVALPAAAWAGPLRSSSTSPTTASSGPSDSTRPGLEALRAKCLAAIDVRLPALAAAKAEAAGRDVTQAKADLDAMKAQIASADAAAGSVPGAVLGLTPADWNANHDVLTPARQQLRVARTDLRVARDLAVKIRNELRTPAPASPAPSTSPQA